MPIGKILKVMVIQIFMISIAFADEKKEGCPPVDPGRSFFDASRLEYGAVVSIEKGVGDYPIIMYLYRPVGVRCKKIEVAKYAVEGGDPNVASIFFMKIKNEINIFSIVKWSVNHRGYGTFGDWYRVYAYEVGNGLVTENHEVSDDVAMSGMEGSVDGMDSSFNYKTAYAVKAYWFHKKSGR